MMNLGRSVVRGMSLSKAAKGAALFRVHSPPQQPLYLNTSMIVGGGSCVRGLKSDGKNETTVTLRQDAFDFVGDRKRDKALFLEMVERFKYGNPHHKGHVEFIMTALKHLREFDVHRDLEIYIVLMDLFPKKVMIAKNLTQAAFQHYPRHQDTAMEILSAMEGNFVLPSREMRELILSIFGPESHVFKKFSRMMYWMPKFRNASPWPLPRPLPKVPRELALIAVNRMASADPGSEVTELHSKDVPDSIDKTWIISAQSKKQQILLRDETGDVPLRIEGPHRIWLRESLISYFVLVGEPREKPIISINTSNVSQFKLTYFGEKQDPAYDVDNLPNVHEQTDGTIYAVCTTGTSSRDSLLSWIRLLEKSNPCLQHLPVVFKLLAPTSALTAVGTKPANESLYEKEMESEYPRKHDEVSALLGDKQNQVNDR